MTRPLPWVVWPLKVGTAATQQHGWYMSIWGLYEWVFLHQYLNQPWSEPASLKAHRAPWISSRCTSVTLIFIWVHIIYVGTLWSASELSIHKAMQERGLEESDNAVSTNTAQMIGEDKSFGGEKKKKKELKFYISDDLKANRPCFVTFNHIAFLFLLVRICWANNCLFMPFDIYKPFKFNKVYMTI